MKGNIGKDMTEFQNKIVFVTGASRGIGSRIKQSFENKGACVISPDRSALDLSSQESIEDYLKIHDCPNIDIFVHCAGLNIKADLFSLNRKIMDDVFQVNYFSAVQLMKNFAQGMKERNWGRIVLLSSLYATVSKEQRIAYSSSKNAITGLIKTLTLELAPYNVLTNAVAPGYVLTDMTKKNLSESEIADICQKIPTGRFQTTEEIADLVMFLCSEANKSITGQLISVDGGFLCN